jgi:hypothetical protein
MKKKIMLAAAAVAMSGLLLGSCGSGDSEETPVRLSVCNGYVGEEALSSYEAKLQSTYDWADEIELEGISLGSEDLDGLSYGTAIMQLSARAAGKELDVMICGSKDAARNARNETFSALDEFFTEEELAQFEGRLLSYDEVDDSGNPTGEQTAVCGVRLEDEALDAIYGSDEYGVFIVCSTTHPDEAKEIFLSLAE